MFAPEDPLAPLEPAFSEPWHAQALALADGLVRSGHVTADAWGQCLGAALREAEAAGADDTAETYYRAVVVALETISEQDLAISKDDRDRRRAAWEAAYRSTPHGKPVTLGAED